MGILQGKPGDFQQWVKNNSDNLQHRFSWFRDPSSGPDGAGEECNHYPRAIMGEYLKTRFQEAAQLAQDMGLAIRLYPASEVVDLRQNDGKISLIIKDLLSENDFSSDVDRVLLATGHWVGKSELEFAYGQTIDWEEIVNPINSFKPCCRS
jgi:uncharacterized NAD(P)/FAD-binding protein YdhS